MDEPIIFETHAHFDSRQFDEDRDEVLKKIHAGAGVCCGERYSEGAGNEEPEKEDVPPSMQVPVGRIINVGADMKGSRASVNLAHKYDFVYAAVGIHPDEAGEIVYSSVCDEDFGNTAGSETGNPTGSETVNNNTVQTTATEARRGAATGEESEHNFRELRRLAKDEKTVAIGEIGLDYHWNIWPREVQREAFIRQWNLADELNLPVIIHSRDAAEDTLELVKARYEALSHSGGSMHGAEKMPAHRGLRAVMHCYSYSVEQAREYLKMGLYFGIGGVVTFKNAKKLKEVVAELPLDRILLETDCPYMAPEPFRGKRNDSGKICYVAEMIAQIKGISVNEVYEVTYRNAIRFFDPAGRS